MYEDRREKFSFRSFFLTLLLVLLFIFIMLWLFPTKSYVDEKLQSSSDIQDLSIIYDEIFANNVERMKDAGIGYFTNERLPQVVGQSKKLTLQEMYDLHLILKLKDKDGNACDVKKSYIEMTKYDKEYRMKVNLSCGEYEDYIIVYLGCYNYCEDGICEKRVETSTSTSGGKVTGTVTPNYGKPDKETTTKTCVYTNGKYYDNKGNVVSKTQYQKACGIEDKKICVIVDGKYYGKNGTEVSETVYKKTCGSEDEPTVTKKYMYEYKLVVKGYKYWKEWSLWSKTKVTSTSTREVETKTQAEISGYKTAKIKTGTRTYDVVTGTKKVKYKAGTTTELVATTKKVPTGTKTVTSTVKVKVGETYTCGTTIKSNTTMPTSTTKMHYEFIGTTSNKECANCGEVTMYTYYECPISAVYDTKTITQEVPQYKTVTVYEEKEVPLYKYKTVNTYKTVTEDIYVTKTIPVYTNVTYYRYRDLVVVEGYTDIKWSESKYDKTLISKKYVLTGNVKEV